MSKQPLITLLGTGLDGGIGRNLLNLTNGFLRRGCRVDLILNDDSGPYVPQLHSEVRLLAMPTSHAIMGVPWLAYYLQKNRPSALLTPNVRLTLLGYRASRLAFSKPRVFANVHNTYSIKFQDLAPAKRAKRLKLIQRIYPRCDGIICVSAGVADDFSAYTGITQDRLSVIYNPVDLDQVSVLSKDSVEHPWFNDGQPPVIVSVGRLSKEKNLGLLIQAFERVRGQLPARLVIVGEGSYSSAYREMAADSRHAADIDFVGHQVNPWKYIARAAVFVLSSNVEGFGNVLIEALAVGTPVVSTDCPSGPREILDNGHYGELVPMDDPPKMAAAIRDSLHHPRSCRMLRNSVRRFGLDRVIERYLQTFGLSERL